jgi:hypothetical protein
VIIHSLVATLKSKKKSDIKLMILIYLNMVKIVFQYEIKIKITEIFLASFFHTKSSKSGMYLTQHRLTTFQDIRG